MARAKAEKPYHHGELREALVAAGISSPATSDIR